MVGDNAESTASFVTWIGKKHGSNLLFDSLWDEGCVFYARTSQPQAIMHLETTSPTYGRTVNPYNRNLSPGGSTGGESALLGMHGSILVSCDMRWCRERELTTTRELVATSGAVFAVQLPTSGSMDSSE